MTRRSRRLKEKRQKDYEGEFEDADHVGDTATKSPVLAEQPVNTNDTTDITIVRSSLSKGVNTELEMDVPMQEHGIAQNHCSNAESMGSLQHTPFRCSSMSHVEDSNTAPDTKMLETLNQTMMILGEKIEISNQRMAEQVSQKLSSKKETANDRKADQKQDNPSSCTTENKSEINEVELLKKEIGVNSTGREKAHALIESKTDNDQDKIPRINDNEPNDISIVRRRKPKDDGVYVEGSVEGIKIIFTADTGATKSVISDRVCKRISEECRPKLTPTVKLSGPGGDPLKELGKARFNLELDNFKLSEDLIVAEIADDGLLGVDVLQNHSLGPADILLSKGIIRLGGNEINCMQIGIQNKTRKVTVADHIDIPGYSEAVIDVFVEDGDEELDVDENMIIEPVANLSERYSIIMGRVVVDTRNNATVKVRVMNLYPNMVSINQDAVIGQAETCTILNPVFISMRPVKYTLVGRRGRAYECGSCHNYQGEKRDVQSHFYNNHVKPEDIPFRFIDCGKEKAMMLKSRSFCIQESLLKKMSNLSVLMTCLLWK
ncbi:hypothetical protein KUTeg_013189 [Tegillarca granosa]|uniref:Peptidase A2 domain-containing protein n=1 Tax=Tegillarca granosa TaxID=220873 RepID=A0ABQ9ET31_TEGGR|nr:hypothetical protein KUTeg_013189 [Tegillarca granosa]